MLWHAEGLTNKKAVARQKSTNEDAQSHDTGTNQCESFDRQNLNIGDAHCSHCSGCQKLTNESALAAQFSTNEDALACPELTNESGLMVGRGGGHGLLVGLVKSPDFVLLAVEDPAFPGAEVHQVQSHRRGVVQRICSTRIELGQFRVRSFSRPEKLPLKIHTSSSGTVYSYWVEKALLFSNCQVLVVNFRARMFPILADFLATLKGGGGD